MRISTLIAVCLLLTACDEQSREIAEDPDTAILTNDTTSPSEDTTTAKDTATALDSSLQTDTLVPPPKDTTTAEDTAEPPPIRSLEGYWYGGELIGGCVDEHRWLAFGGGGASSFTHGIVNNNTCMPPELLGLEVCDGTFNRPTAGSIALSCTSTRNPSIRYTSLDATRMTYAILNAPDVLTFMALEPSGVDTWKRQFIRNSAAGGSTESVEIEVILKVPGWPSSPSVANMGTTYAVEMRLVVTHQRDTNPALILDVVLAFDAPFAMGGGRGHGELAADFVQEASSPSSAWHSFVRSQPEVDNDNLGIALESVSHVLYYDEGTHTFYNDEFWGFQPFPLQWRPSDAEPCDAYDGMRSYNGELDAWCSP